MMKLTLPISGQCFWLEQHFTIWSGVHSLHSMDSTIIIANSCALGRLTLDELMQYFG